MKKFFSFIKNIIGTAGVFLFFLLLCALLEEIPYNRVNPPFETSLEQWIQSYKTVLYYVFCAALGGTLLWNVLEEWIIRPHYVKARSARFRWVVFLILQIGFLAASVLYTNRMLPADGEEIVYLLYALAGIVPYYISTLFFSPSAVKYTVPVSRNLRFW